MKRVLPTFQPALCTFSFDFQQHHCTTTRTSTERAGSINREFVLCCWVACSQTQINSHYSVADLQIQNPDLIHSFKLDNHSDLWTDPFSTSFLPMALVNEVEGLNTNHIHRDTDDGESWPNIVELISILTDSAHMLALRSEVSGSLAHLHCLNCVLQDCSTPEQIVCSRVRERRRAPEDLSLCEWTGGSGDVSDPIVRTETDRPCNKLTA